MQHVNMKMVAITLVHAVFTVAMYFMAMIFCPEVVMHIGCIASPIMSLLIAFYSVNPYVQVMSVIVAIISFAFYLFYLRHQIKYAAKVAKSTARTLSNGLFTVIVSLVLTTTFWLVMCYIYMTSIFQMEGTRDVATLIFASVLLSMFWIFFTLFYFLRVFVSSLVIVDYLFDGLASAQKLTTSIKNSLFAIGSVCFGALIIAIVTTVRALIDREMNERTRERSVIATIFQFILLFLIDLLRDIINYANQWAFCYIALTGKDYILSIKESFRILTSNNNRSITNDLAISSLFSFVSMMSFLLYLAIIFFTCRPFASDEIDFLLFTILSYAYFNYAITVVFDSGVKSVLFTYALFPEEVKRKDEALAIAIEEQRKT